MASELGYKYSTARRLVSSLMKKGLMKYFVTGSKNKPNAKFLCIKLLIVNPYVFTRWSRVNKAVESYFTDAGWKWYSLPLLKNKTKSNLMPKKWVLTL